MVLTLVRLATSTSLIQPFLANTKEGKNLKLDTTGYNWRLRVKIPWAEFVPVVEEARRGKEVVSGGQTTWDRRHLNTTNRLLQTRTRDGAAPDLPHEAQQLPCPGADQFGSWSGIGEKK